MAAGAAAAQGLQYASQKFNEASAGAELTQKRKQVLAQVDTITGEIVKSSEQQLQHLMDLKAKLHHDRYEIEEKKDMIADTLMDLDTNHNLLEQRNQQIEQSLAA